VTVAQSP
jgi:CHAD domain-containing protein